MNANTITYTRDNEMIHQLNDIINYRKTHKITHIKYLLSDELREFILSKTPFLSNKAYKWTQRIHWIVNDLKDFPVCKNNDCNNILDNPKYFIDIEHGYRQWCCLDCFHQDVLVKNKRNSVINKKYKLSENSYTNIFQTDECKEKIKQYYTSKYGAGIINIGQVINRKMGYDNFLKNVYVKPLFSYDEYNDMCIKIDRYHNKELFWECKKCGYQFHTNVKTKLLMPDGIHKTNIICPKCFPSISTTEKQLHEFVKSIYKGSIIFNDRSILLKEYDNSWKRNKEIDIWFPDMNKAIEFNGTYYHMDPRFYNSNDKPRNEVMAEQIWKNDKIKADIINKLGIELMIVWEYDWKNDLKITQKKVMNFILN